jgi:predicted nucleotidyltransferase
MNIKKQNNKIIIEIQEEEIKKLLKEEREKARAQYFYFARAILSFMKRNKQKFNNEFKFETLQKIFNKLSEEDLRKCLEYLKFKGFVYEPQKDTFKLV